MSQCIKAPKGANRNKIIQGRGSSARRGRACGRGHDGQNSRSGGGVRPGFEGGQMPLYRRIAARGFSNSPFKKGYEIISLKEINKTFSDGDTVNLEALKEKRLIKKQVKTVKVLGDGDLDKIIHLVVDKVSAAAKIKIEKAGGSVVETALKKNEVKEKEGSDG